MKASEIAGAAVVALLVAAPLHAEIRVFELDGFDEISLTEGLEATIVIGDGFGVSAEARNVKTLEKLDIEVRGHTLHLGRDNSLFDSFFGGGNNVSIEISLPDLNEISVSSGSGATVTGEFGPDFEGSASSGSNLILTGVTSSRVELSASSGSDIEATGACEHLDASASSGASIEASGLRCDTVDVSASSGASADVFAREALESSASSGGDVDVYGGPESTDISDSSGGDTDLKG